MPGTLGGPSDTHPEPASSYRWIVLDALRPAAELESRVWGIIAPRLGLPAD